MKTKFGKQAVSRFVLGFAVLCCFMPLSRATPAFATPVPVDFFDGQFAAVSSIIAIAGDILAVAGGNSSGPVVYVYQRINGVWVESGRLSTSDEQSNGNPLAIYGTSLAISPDEQAVFVGDPGALCPGSSTLPCGAVDVYQKPSGGWGDLGAPTARLRPSATASEELGLSMAISSDGATLVAYGDAAYVYVKPTSGWTSATQTAVLGTASGTAPSGVAVAVGVDDGVVAANTTAQSVLVYVEPPGGWQDAATATATLSYSGHFDSGLGDFGGKLKVSGGNVILVGAPGLSLALVYQEPGGGWADATSPTAVLQQPAGSSFFPSGLNMVGATAVVSDDTGLLFYDKPVTGWSSEAPTSSIVPGFSGSGPTASGFGSIYVTGTEFAVSARSPCSTGPASACVMSYVLSSTAAGTAYSGMIIDDVSVDDLTDQQVRVGAGDTGDEFNFNFDVTNVAAPARGTATFEATVSGGTMTTATVDGFACSVSGVTAMCDLDLAPGKASAIQVTVQTKYNASAATVSATLNSVSPQSWDPLDSSLSDSVPLAVVPVVPASVSYSGFPGQTITGTLPASYAGKNSLAFKIRGQPGDGTLTVDAATGNFTWVPPPAKPPNRTYVGSTGFSYYVTDGVNQSPDVNVTITEQQTGGGGGGGFFGIAQLAVLLSLLLFARRGQIGKVEYE